MSNEQSSQTQLTAILQKEGVRYFRAPSAPCTLVTPDGKSLVARDGIFSTGEFPKHLAFFEECAEVMSLYEVSKEVAEATAAFVAADSVNNSPVVR